MVKCPKCNSISSKLKSNWKCKSCGLEFRGSKPCVDCPKGLYNPDTCGEIIPLCRFADNMTRKMIAVVVLSKLAKRTCINCGQPVPMNYDPSAVACETCSREAREEDEAVGPECPVCHKSTIKMPDGELYCCSCQKSFDGPEDVLAKWTGITCPECNGTLLDTGEGLECDLSGKVFEYGEIGLSRPGKVEVH